MDFIHVLVIGIFIIIAVSVVIGLRKRHVAKKRKERLCSCGCVTVRRCQMIDDSDGYPPYRLRRRYLSYVFDECISKQCDKVKCVKKKSKWFSLYKLAWRHFWDPDQFTVDEKLFKRAGLILAMTDSLPERMQIAQEAAERRIQRIGHILPVSPKLPDPELRQNPTRLLMAARQRVHHKPDQ